MSAWLTSVKTGLISKPDPPTRTVAEQDARISSHVRAEQALTPGPDHQPWPFVCPYCSETFQTDSGWFPFCSAHCSIDAENDR